MTAKALVKQAELKRMAAIAKSEGVVVSVEVDGRKFSVSPFLTDSTSTFAPAQSSNVPPDHRASKKALSRAAVAMKSVADWYDRLGFDPSTMNKDDYKRLFKEEEERWRREIPTLPMKKLEQSALKQLLLHGAGVVVEACLIKPCGDDTAERLQARGFIEFRMHDKFPDQVEAYVLTEAGHAAAVKLSDQS